MQKKGEELEIKFQRKSQVWRLYTSQWMGNLNCSKRPIQNQNLKTQLSFSSAQMRSFGRKTQP